MAISIRQAQSSDVGVVGELVHALLSELTPPAAEPPKIEIVRPGGHPNSPTCGHLKIPHLICC